ncbi:MAG: hypothetical protein EAZ53_08305 [Bacteroidetes bacterium]|nr:MAG: hypothetical protein EAZ53_08305 [Bacteroidota bacterium]
MTNDQVKEKIKQLNEWFKLFCTLLVLDTGAIGIVISRNQWQISLYESVLLIVVILLWFVVLSILVIFNQIISKNILKLN